MLYLRIVHSLDYYNFSDYPYEDEMPNRCGILHVRGTEPDKSTQADGELQITLIQIITLIHSLLDESLM